MGEQLIFIQARQEQAEFQEFCRAKGLLCAVRGVIIITATPIATTHNLPSLYHQGELDIIALEPPKNHVTYPHFAHPSARHCITTRIVPGRSHVKKVTIGQLYEHLLADAKILEMSIQAGYFRRVGKALRCCSKRKIMESQELQLIQIVHKAGLMLDEINRSVAFRQRLDLPGIRLMLEAMASDPTEPERRALILTSLTKTDAQKAALAARLLSDDRDEPISVYEFMRDVFVARFSHKKIDLQWRADSDIGHSDVLAALDAHGLPYKTDADDGDDDGDEPPRCVRILLPNINLVYAALDHFVAQKPPGYKLRSIVIAGEIGGRGLNYKPSATHSGYLTDMFAMFDVFKGRMAAHGESWTQYLGRLATVVDRAMLKRMERTPPTLWTSPECAECVHVWFCMMPQYMSALASRNTDETNGEAVARCINENPLGYGALNTAMTQEVQGLPPNKRGRTAGNKLPLTRLRAHDESLTNQADRQIKVAAAQFQFPPQPAQQSFIAETVAQFAATAAAVPLPVVVPVSAPAAAPTAGARPPPANLDELVSRVAIAPLIDLNLAKEDSRRTYIRRIRDLIQWNVVSRLQDLVPLGRAAALQQNTQFYALALDWVSAGAAKGVDRTVSACAGDYASTVTKCLNFCNLV